ncbi:MAG: DUF2851 family protein [Ignavibacteriales bacterium]|nr:DUF2851 family protein [Ignavibacteriales bacterium]
MHEDLLRHIWSRQLFDASRLVTTDKRSLLVVNPGTLHRGSGPDFRNAVIEIGGTKFTGDIEFHRTTEDWSTHNHHNDPAYNSVILHVVLQGNPSTTHSHSGRTIPTIILEPYLLTSLQTIADQLSREEYSSINRPIKCASVNDDVEAPLLNDWILTMYRERVQEKVHRMYERLCDIIISQRRIIGEPHPPYNEMLDPGDIPLPDANIDKEHFKQKLPWEQLLYEGIMDGLGYSNNRDGMKSLAENVSILQWKNLSSMRELSANEIQSVLFKASGLLPGVNDLSDQQSKVYVHQLHALWKDLPVQIPLMAVHSSVWNFSPTRPSNFPTIRIAAAGVMLHKILHRSLFKSLVTLIGGKYSPVQSKTAQLLALFDSGDDAFWNYHYSFTEATHQKHTLLGESRKYDIIVNTIIPFICLYAKVFGKSDLAEHCLNLAVELPLLEENTILRTMNNHLVKGKIKIAFAYQQQGLIQLNKKYCVVERCGECEVGKKLSLV